MTIKDFDTKKVILEDQYKSDEYETMTLWLTAIALRFFAVNRKKVCNGRA